MHPFTLKTSLVVKRTRKHGSLFIEYLSLALKTKNSCQFIELNYEHNVLTTTTIGMRQNSERLKLFLSHCRNRIKHIKDYEDATADLSEPKK